MSQTPVLFLAYPRCATCRKAKRWLDDQSVLYEERHIVEQNPTVDELSEWLERSGLPVRRFFNTSGKLYREMGIKDKLAAGMTEEDCLELLAQNGMLVKRPIIVADDFVLVGFKESDWADRLVGVEG